MSVIQDSALLHGEFTMDLRTKSNDSVPPSISLSRVC